MHHGNSKGGNGLNICIDDVGGCCPILSLPCDEGCHGTRRVAGSNPTQTLTSPHACAVNGSG